jgi:hypothetical protein
MIVFSQNFLAVVLFFFKNKQSIGEVGVKGIKRLNEQGEEGQGTLNSRQHVGWQGREGVGATSIMAKMPAWPQSLDRTHTREGKKYRTRRCCFRIFTILINFAYHVIISCFSATTVLTLNQREGDNYCFFFNISLFKNILKLFFITKK